MSTTLNNQGRRCLESWKANRYASPPFHPSTLLNLDPMNLGVSLVLSQNLSLSQV
jgi:hypothetical protein